MARLHLLGGLLAVAVLVAAAKPMPPVLPSFFTANFTEYTVFNRIPPPYRNGLPAAPFKASRGFTIYDWATTTLIEHRYDYCVDIFPGVANDFPCTFWDVNGTSFLTSDPAKSGLPGDGCCVFGDPWYPPPPDFLRARVNSTYGGELTWDTWNATWWENRDIPPPAGPFWWSFADGSASPQVYTSFSFPGISGWVQQNFWAAQNTTRPTPAMTALPASCLPRASVPNCNFFGAPRRPRFV
jgi:hypothetical protein